MNFLQKLRREIVKPLSKICLQMSKSNYFGLELKVPVLNGIGAGYLVPGDEWMGKCLSLFLKQKEGAIIDIGANIGLYLVKLKSLDKDRGYFGFEPNPVCNFYTQELIGVNEFKNVRIFPFALSNTKELRTFYAKRKADKMGSLHDYARPGEVKKNSFEVFTFSGDEFLELLNLDRVCGIKIDVEGFELEVLEGIQNTLVKYQPLIFCEIWHLPEKSDPTYEEKQRRLIEICKLLKELDYIILGFNQDDFSRVEINKYDDFDNAQLRDYVLLHRNDRDSITQSFDELS